MSGGGAPSLTTRVHSAHVNPVPVRRDAVCGPEAAAADAELFNDPLSEENMVRVRAHECRPALLCRR